ncbi:MAG: hypothetical protein OXG39_18690 [Chloroflexi bacterium]|nr:hypothetical protein [Chloroflexota bacterium]
MAFDCPQHAGKRNEYSRLKLDDLMKSLHKNQSGAGRHKCPYCAYEQGYKRGVEHGRNQAANKIRDFILHEE